ncbi:hypothetical protein PTKIN_Ptkin08bG0160700 [Pterospermum kingtungense]
MDNEDTLNMRKRFKTDNGMVLMRNDSDVSRDCGSADGSAQIRGVKDTVVKRRVMGKRRKVGKVIRGSYSGKVDEKLWEVPVGVNLQGLEDLVEDGVMRLSGSEGSCGCPATTT